MMYCPDCSQEKESKGVGLCGECYQLLKKKLENLSKRHADLFENSLSMQAKIKAATALVDVLIEAGESLKGSAESYAMQTYDRQGTTRKAIDEWDAAVATLEEK